jgi:hypothetical protein
VPVIAAVGVVVALLAAVAFNSYTNDSPAPPIQPAPVNLASTPAETRSEAPIEQAHAPAAELPFVESAQTAEAEPPLLVAADLVAPYALVPSLEPGTLDSLSFDVGSSRAEVVAAQGRPSTYAAHHDRSLWWGSSRVDFDKEGKVHFVGGRHAFLERLPAIVLEQKRSRQLQWGVSSRRNSALSDSTRTGTRAAPVLFRP